MASLDPKSFKQLSNLIKTLSASGEEITKKSRELITIMISIQRGWIETGQRMDDVLSDVISGKFEKGKFKETFDGLAKSEDALARIVKLSEQVNKLDVKRLDSIKTEADLEEVSLSLFRDRHSVVGDISTLYDKITDQLTEEAAYLKDSGVMLNNQTEYLENQVKARGTLRRMLKGSLLDNQQIERSLSTIQDVIDNIAGDEFDIVGVGKFDRSEIYAEMERLSSDNIALINAEMRTLDRELQALAAKELGVEVNFNTGDILDIDTSKLLEGAEFDNAKAHIAATSSEYDKLVSYMSRGNKLTQDQSDMLKSQTKLILESAAARQSELDTLKTSFDTKTDEVSLGLARDRSGIMVGISDLYSKIIDQVKTEKRFLTDSNIQLEDQSAYIREQIKSRQLLNDLTKMHLVDNDSITKSLSNIKTAVDGITGIKFTIDGVGTFDRSGIVAELEKASKESMAMINAEAELLDKQLRAIAAQSMDMEVNFKTGEVIDLKSKSILGGDDLTKAYGLITDATSEYSKYVDQIAAGNELTHDQISLLDEPTRLILEAVGAKQMELDTWRQTFDAASKNLTVVAQFVPHLKAAQTAGDGIASAFERAFSYLPQGIQNLLGVADIGDRIREANTTAMSEFKDVLMKTGSPAEALSTSFGKWRGLVSGLINPFTVVLGLATSMFKITDMIQDNYKDLAQQLNIGTGQAKKLYHANLDLVSSQKNQFMTMKEIQSVQEAYVHATGQTFELTKKGGQELAITLGEMGKAFGYGAKTSVEIYESFKRLGADKGLANKLQAELGFMTEMAGMTPNLIANDLLESADEIATYFAGMPEAAARTALSVRRMGVSLKQATNTAQKMLNLEGFMTDMFELSAMGGPDLSGAFEFGIRGDIEGMTEAIMDSIGSVKEFGELDFLQRQKIAQTIGMTTGELSQSLMLREQLANVSKKDADFVKKNMDQFGNIADMDSQAVKDRIDQVQSTERLTVAWDKIKAVLIKAILPAVESFTVILQSSGPLIDTIIGGFTIIGGIVKGIGWVISGILLPLKWINKLIGVIQETFFKTKETGEDANVVLASMGDAFGLVANYAQTLIGIVTSGMMAKHLLGVFIPSVRKSRGVFSLLGQSATKTFGLFGTGAKGAADKVMTLGGLATKKFGKGGILGKVFGKVPTDKLSDVVKKFSGTVTDKLGGLIPKTGILGKLFGKTPDKVMAQASKKLKSVASDALTPNSKGGILSRLFGKTPTTELDNTKKGLGEIIKSKLPKKGILGKLLGTTTDKIEMPDVDTKKLTDTIEMPDIDTKKLTEMDIPFGDKIKDRVSKLGDCMKEGFTKVKSVAKDGLDNLVDILKKGWELVKDTLLEIVDFAVSILQKVATGLGNAIKSLLIGIGDGLESFGGKALKGASTLVALSGALWITSKALQNFGDVSWEDVAQATIVLGGLVGFAMLLGKSTSQMITGAAAIAILGASLVPVGLALKMMTDVDWNTVGIAGTALVGLGVAGGIIGNLAPTMLVGAMAIAALGASLLPLAFSLSVLDNVGWETLAQSGVALTGLGVAAAILGSTAPLMLVGAMAIAALGASLLPLSTAMTIMDGVGWDTLAQAGVALTGLGIAAGILGTASPLILVGAMSIAALGTALLPLAASMSIMNSVGWETLAQAGVALTGLGVAAGIMGLTAPLMLVGATAIAALGVSLIPFAGAIALLSSSNLGEIGLGLTAISGGIFALATASSTGGIMGLFKGDPISQLKDLAEIASPLDIAANAIQSLGGSLSKLSEVLANIDISKLADLDKIKGIATSIRVGYQMRGEGGKQTIQPPEASATAQNVKVHEPPQTATAQNVSIKTDMASSNTPAVDPIQKAVEDARASSSGGSTKLETLMMQLIGEIRSLNNRPIVLDFGDGVLKEVNRRSRGLNNNR